nr:hypothetical protein [Tanacetum cinerariifolium]
KPHDESSSQVPKGSGNPNPTSSSSNPPADQMETLIVEFPIPNVSSPVPTACLNDSPEPSSKVRLILKRVANQEETPSMDNILLLTNRFEDILGVTTSSDEAIGVEADVSNMETTISASPTPTLRIHKDHPKSKIIEPKKVSDALQDPSWVEAMQEDLLQFKIQKVWTLVDCPKGFEDILGVSISSDETIGVEADVSNMETSISASPTPTLKIHKDHPKSQIIGHVDTLIQTSHKSKMVEEQKPKKVSNALQDPSWVEAMQEELLQFKIQNVWTLVDCPKGVKPIGTKWVLKNKKD